MVANFSRHVRTMSSYTLKNYVSASAHKFIGTVIVKRAVHDVHNRGISSYIHHVGCEPLKYLTVGQILQEAADAWPERPAVISRQQKETLLFSDLLIEADQLAASFLEIGLKPRDRVGIWCPNSTQWIITMLASSRAGLISVAINPSYQKKEIEYCLRKVGVKALVVPEQHNNLNYYQMLMELIPELATSRPGHLDCAGLPQLKSVILVTEKKDRRRLPGVFQFNELKSLASSVAVGKIARKQHLIKPDSGCNVQFTSGTTGQPKAPVLTHMGLVNNGYFTGLRNELNNGHNKICVQVPLFHVFGVVVSLCAGIQHGATLVLPSGSYSTSANVQALLEEKCSVIFGTPTMYVDLIDAVKKIGANVSARVACTGGALVSAQLIKDMGQVLNVNVVKSIYGMTEGTGVSFQSLPGEDSNVPTYSVGHVQDHLEVKVLDSEGNMLPHGTPGELYVRGYSTMIGYWDDEEKTKEVIGADGWTRTGDLVVLTEDGYCNVVGRLKDIIIRGGENISPKEIEDVVSSHPDVLECHVFGVADPRMGEEVCVAVRTRNSKSISHEELKRHCAGHLAHYKVPRYVKRVDVFPKTTSGKIQKFRLREMVEKGDI